VELREIRVFLALAEELHFGRTAHRLGLTQSRVSQTLRTLESKLADQLLRRTSRHVALTTAGERLLTEVGEPYREMLDALGRCSGADRPLHGTLRLGVVAAGAVAPGLLRVVELFEARYPECRVEIAELPFRERYCAAAQRGRGSDGRAAAAQRPGAGHRAGRQQRTSRRCGRPQPPTHTTGHRLARGPRRLPPA
jgi:DNA-binding transcriptional LysR family regulator